MKITYQDNKNSGFIDNIHITEKPIFSFPYEWFLVNNEVAEYTPKDRANYPDLVITEEEMANYVNRPLSEVQLQEVITFYNSYPREPETKPPFDEATQKLIEDGTEVIGGLTYKKYTVQAKTAEELAQFKDNLAAQKKSELALVRFQKETAGINFNGMPVATDRPSQAMLTGAYTTVQVNPEMVIDWKGESGWVQLNKAAIEMLSQAVAAHIQACFTNEKTISELIDTATTVAELEAIDLNGGWPV